MAVGARHGRESIGEWTLGNRDGIGSLWRRGSSKSAGVTEATLGQDDSDRLGWFGTCSRLPITERVAPIDLALDGRESG
jgi:hypothetical protein